MMTCKPSILEAAERFQYLSDSGAMAREDLYAAVEASFRRDIPVGHILRYEFNVPRRVILEALSRSCGCRWVEYDERVPVPPELLKGLSSEMLCTSQWFPVFRSGHRIVVAASDPGDTQVTAEAQARFPDSELEFRVALEEDIEAFIHDFLRSDPAHLTGSERTGLASWRNNMARWRTRLACYRTDLAKARTYLNMLRGGLTLVVIARALMQLHRGGPAIYVYWTMIAAGCCLFAAGIYAYRTVRSTIWAPPRHQTLVEVTNASLLFLENYQYKDSTPPVRQFARKTMLARLLDGLVHTTIDMEGSTDNKPRSLLAHERNTLAAQRTVAACYRTVYARARTGLSFIRTGVAISGICIGFLEYFSPSVLSMLDGALLAISIAMIIDGAIWYVPARKESSEFPIQPEMPR